MWNTSMVMEMEFLKDYIRDHLVVFGKIIFNISFLLFLNVIFLTWFLASIWVKRRREKQTWFKKCGIPFIEPHLLYGNHHLLRNTPNKNELQVMEGWIKTYGKVFGFFVGFSPYLVIADLDIAKEVLIKRSANYINRPKLAIKAYPVTDTVVGLRNKRWKEVRAMLAHAFTPSKLKIFAINMNAKLDILFTLIDKSVNVNKPLEWYSTFQGLTLDIISSCAFAMETDCIRLQNDDPLFASVRDFLEKAVNSAVIFAQYCPLLAEIMTVINNYWSKSGKATIMIVDHLSKVIAKRRLNKNERRQDFLQTILDSSEDASEFGKDKINKFKPITDKELIANSWVFLLGGYETTAATITFTTYLLAKHPEIQEKLYKEIKEHVSKDDDGHISYDDVMKLSYLDQIISESLRLYPPVSSFVQREAMEEDIIQGYRIPEKTTLVFPIWHIHHNPEYWPDPYKFDPDRFSPDDKTNTGRHSLAYLPFGAGPRNCIGMRFGQLSSKIALSRIFSIYKFEVCDETPEDLTMTISTVTLIPREKIFLRATRRENQ